MSIINSKTISRLAAIQGLYQYNFAENKNADEIIDQIEHLYSSGTMSEELEMPEGSKKIKLNKSFFRELLNQCVENIEKIDDKIADNLANEWTMANLHDNLKALLRCGVCEIMYFPEVPFKVVINEYTNIASEMLKDTEVGFINSILDSINKDFRTDVKK